MALPGKLKKTLKPILKELEGLGCSTQIESGSKHHMVVGEIDGKPFRWTLSGDMNDGRGKLNDGRGKLNAIGNLRKELRNCGVEPPKGFGRRGDEPGDDRFANLFLQINALEAFWKENTRGE